MTLEEFLNKCSPKYGALLKPDDDKGIIAVSLLKQAIIIKHLTDKIMHLGPDNYMKIYDSFNTCPTPYFTYNYSRPNNVDPNSLSEGCFITANNKILKEIKLQDHFIDLVMFYKDYEKAYKFLKSTCYLDFDN